MDISETQLSVTLKNSKLCVYYLQDVPEFISWTASYLVKVLCPLSDILQCFINDWLSIARFSNCGKLISVCHVLVKVSLPMSSQGVHLWYHLSLEISILTSNIHNSQMISLSISVFPLIFYVQMEEIVFLMQIKPWKKKASLRDD